MLDISLVVFRPNLSDLERTLRSLAAVRAEFNTLWILVSGRSDVATSVKQIVRDVGLVDAVCFEHRFDNLGFASGHNRLLARAFSAGSSSTLVLNPDVLIEPGALLALVAATTGASKNFLYGPALARIEEGSAAKPVTDSLGISWSSSGRHFDIQQGRELPPLDGKAIDVAGVTGACMLVKRSSYDSIVARSGYFFDDSFLAYREDAELCVRATLVGVGSRSLMISGFSHVRSVRGFQRGKEIPDLLGVRNRFLMKWRLGKHRPGSALLSFFRDVLVILAVIIKERTSLPGLRESFAIRRFCSYTSSISKEGFQ